MPIVLARPEFGLTTGSNTEAVSGSGFSMPTGVESIYEYNGIYMNIRDWIDTILITGIGGFDDAEVRDVRDVNPDDDGETPYDSKYAGRPLTLEGKIAAVRLEKLRDIQMGLRGAFAELTEKPLIIRTGDINRDAMIYCKKVGSIAMKEEQKDDRFYREFMISLRASNPRIVSYIQQLVSAVYDAENGYAEADVFNKGNFTAQPLIVVHGGITNPVVTNTVTGEAFSMTGTLAAGDRWTIDFAKESIVDQDDVNMFDVVDDNVDEIFIYPRDNKIHLTGESADGTVSMDVYWRHTWL